MSNVANIVGRDLMNAITDNKQLVTMGIFGAVILGGVFFTSFVSNKETNYQSSTPISYVNDTVNNAVKDVVSTVSDEVDRASTSVINSVSMKPNEPDTSNREDNQPQQGGSRRKKHKKSRKHKKSKKNSKK
jgi:hypothetical protein